MNIKRLYVNIKRLYLNIKRLYLVNFQILWTLGEESEVGIREVEVVGGCG